MKNIRRMESRDCDRYGLKGAGTHEHFGYMSGKELGRRCSTWDRWTKRYVGGGCSNDWIRRRSLLSLWRSGRTGGGGRLVAGSGKARARVVA